MNAPRAAAALLAVCLACGGARPVATHPPPMATPEAMRIVRTPGRPAIAVLTREGDPSPVVAAFVSTAGVAPERGAVVPVALAGLLAARVDGRVTPQADGVRVAVTAPDAAIARVAAALLAPVAPAEVDAARRKVAALATLARVAPDAAPVAGCEGALVPPASVAPPTAAELEAWRAAAATSAHVAFATIGPKHGRIVAPALPAGSAAPAAPEPPALAVYDASGDVEARRSSVALVWRGDLRLLAAARSLGSPDGAFAALLAASDTRAHVRSIDATLSAGGVCLALRADVDDSATSSAGAERLAALVALATRETRAAAEDAKADVATPADAVAAAEQAALIALASSGPERLDDAPRVFVGVSGPPGGAKDAIGSAIATARRAWAAPIVEARSRVERGQPAAWVLVASPCGTAGETDGDAGASAAFAVAAAAAARARGVAADPWTASDGVGVVASGSDARALADALARTFLVDPVAGARAAQARLLDGTRPGLAALAEAIAPGRPASVLPTGTPASLLRLSEAAIAARAEALRHGPLRVATIANADAAQAATAARRVDRWALREGPRSCPARTEAAAPKPGTYAVETDDGTSEAYVAAMVPADQEPQAAAIAGALDGEGGLLGKALSDGLARASGARVLGSPGARALVIHVDAPSTALDAAVAQVRALLDRVRRGAVAEADLARARKHAEAERAARMRDPRQRLIALFRGETTPPATAMDRVRAAAATMLRDDALIVVAARPRAVAPAQKRKP